MSSCKSTNPGSFRYVSIYGANLNVGVDHVALSNQVIEQYHAAHAEWKLRKRDVDGDTRPPMLENHALATIFVEGTYNGPIPRIAVSYYGECFYPPEGFNPHTKY